MTGPQGAGEVNERERGVRGVELACASDEQFHLVSGHGPVAAGAGNAQCPPGAQTGRELAGTSALQVPPRSVRHPVGRRLATLVPRCPLSAIRSRSISRSGLLPTIANLIDESLAGAREQDATLIGQ